MPLRTRPIDPLDSRVPIVDSNGRPTPGFIRQWVQARVVNITVGDITLAVDSLRQLVEDAQAAIVAAQESIEVAEGLIAVLTSREIQAGTGLDGGGSLEDNVELNLADTAVTPGTYGSETHVPRITIDQQGRITHAEEVAIPE